MNLFELFIKVGVDDQASKNLGNITSKLGNGLKTAGKIGLAAVTAAATGITALTTAAVKSYAEYEQLVGGAELMFGEAFETVQKNAQEAYKTVQMSQNEYLQQVNGFATGLKVALAGNEQAAADLANRIVQAEADIIAATGNTAENVQNAFNGVMKSNFTMLDNLQIGITPTKEGFQEVIDKVNEWNKANGEATDYQMGNLADMQSALVDYIDMVGMSGYAQREASKTISGSLASMRSAWKNLLVGMASDNADFEKLVDDLVYTLAGDESGGGVINNILPRIEKAISGIGVLVEKAAPIIAGALPRLVGDLLPSVVGAAVGLVQSFADAIVKDGPAIIQAALDSVFTVLTDGLGMSDELAGGITGVFEKAFSAVGTILESLWGVVEAVFSALGEAAESLGITWDDVFNAIGFVIEGVATVIQFACDMIVQGIDLLVSEAQTDGTFINEVFTGIQGVVSALWYFCVAAFEGISAVFSWVATQANTDGTLINTVFEGVRSFVTTVWENIKTRITAALDVIQSAIQLFTAIIQGDWSAAWDAVKNIAQTTWDAITSIISSVISQVTGFLGEMRATGLELISNLIDAIAEKFAELYDKCVEWVQNNIINPIISMGSSLYEAGVEILNQLWQGLQSVWSSISSWWDGLSFSPKTASVDVSAAGAAVDGSHYSGLAYVPFDGYIAELHKGERVLTAAEASSYNSIAGGVNIVQNIYSEAKTAADLMQEAIYQQERAVLLGV